MSLPPVIEFPPFSDEIALRVGRTDGCLTLLEEPGATSTISDCLADGTRLVFVQRQHPDQSTGDLGDPANVHPSLAFVREDNAVTAWVNVRTEGGSEGWVSHDYLEHY